MFFFLIIFWCGSSAYFTSNHLLTQLNLLEQLGQTTLPSSFPDHLITFNPFTIHSYWLHTCVKDNLWPKTGNLQRIWPRDLSPLVGAAPLAQLRPVRQVWQHLFIGFISISVENFLFITDIAESNSINFNLSIYI